MLAILTFCFDQPPEWKIRKREPYTARHVNALFRAVSANMKVPHRFVCLTDQPNGIECETMPVWPPIIVGGEQSCYRKVRAFDGDFQRSLGTSTLCLDLDAVILGDISHLATDDDCRMFRGSRNPTNGHYVSRYNGSMWLCRSGAREHFWTLFDPELAREERAKNIMPGGKRVQGSDQAWFSCVSPLEKTFGEEHGVYQYYMLKRGHVPNDARMVFFAGGKKPWTETVRHESPKLYAAWMRYAG